MVLNFKIRQKQRFLLAFVLSASGVLATQLWYDYAQNKKNPFANEKPLAWVKSSSKQNHRKEASRALWQNLDKGQALYAGDAVKTGNHSNLELILDQGSLTVSPNTLIVLNRSQEDVELNLLDGDLSFKSSQSGSGQKLTNTLAVKTELGTLDLGKSDSKVKKNKLTGLNVEVFKGEAKLKKAVRTIGPAFSAQLQGASGSLDVQAGQHAELLLQAGSKHFLTSAQAEPKSIALIELSHPNAQSSQELLSTLQKPSNHLRSNSVSQTDTKQLEKLLFTEKWAGSTDVIVFKEKGAHPLLRWKIAKTLNEDYEVLIKAGKNPLELKPLPWLSADRESGNFELNEEKFFFQIEALQKNTQELLAQSKVYYAITENLIQLAEAREANKPSINWVDDNKKLTYLEPKALIPLRWNIKNEQPEQHLKIEVTLLKNSESLESSAKASFTLRDLVQNDWLLDLNQASIRQKFSLDVKQDGPVSGNSDGKNAKSISSSELENFTGDFASFYMKAKIHLLDNKGQVVASSTELTSSISPQELPKPPKLVNIKARENRIIGQIDGKLKVSWQAQDLKSQSFQVRLLQNSELLFTQETTEAFYEFSDLKPGNYTLEVYAQDEQKRPSRSPAQVDALIPNPLSIPKPKLKGIKVNWLMPSGPNKKPLKWKQAEHQQTVHKASALLNEPYPRGAGYL